MARILAWTLVALMSLAGPAMAASSSDAPAADQAASPAATPTVLRGSVPKAPEAASPPSCPNGSYYAPDLGCVVPTEPGYAGSYGSYDIPVVVIGVPGSARRHDLRSFRSVHRFARRTAVPRTAIRGIDGLHADHFGTPFGHNGLR
jgi:hypothetical protein